MEATEKNIKKQIEQCLDLLKNILGDQLLGVYLSGSAIIGGLQKFSDIDVFAICSRGTTYEEKEKIELALLNISGIFAITKDLKPIELTIVVKSDINPWRYPPKFDFQYGDWLRKEFESGTVEPWQTKEMPNLAIVITQILLKSETIFGNPPNTLLDIVPYSDFIRAIIKEVGSLKIDLEWDTRNVLLTYARIWSTIENDMIYSKPDAARWTIDRLPVEYKPVMHRALAISLGEKKEYWDDMKGLIKLSTEFMINKIKEKISELKSSDYSKKSIKLHFG